jgi:hypothetical protein
MTRAAILVALGLCASLGAAPKDPAAVARGVARVPLTDMGAATYLGFTGGLYPGPSNDVPVDHYAGGLEQADLIVPRNAAGAPRHDGRVVMVSIGMSNTTQEFCGGATCAAGTFMARAAADAAVNHTTLAIVDGAAGSQTADTWDSPTDANYDRVRDTRLSPRGLSEAQVQVAWVKVANAGPTVSLPGANADAYRLVTQTGNILRALKSRYRNIRQVYLSTRIYAGYASTTLNPEPYAYESGFAAKWVIEAQIQQMRTGQVDPRAGNLDYRAGAGPWVGWGAYLWADGTNPRSDGLVWLPADLGPDGTHPSAAGRAKVGLLLLDSFKQSDLSQCWFLAGHRCRLE